MERLVAESMQSSCVIHISDCSAENAADRIADWLENRKGLYLE